MSIRKKGKNWYYEITIDGKRYNGTCEDCTTKLQAVNLEKNKKKQIKEERVQSNVIAYHEKKIVEAMGAKTISLYDAYDIAVNKPFARVIKEKTKNQNRQYFLDFAQFAEKKYGATMLHHINLHIAEQYIQYIRSNGRYNKTIQYLRGKKIIIQKNTTTTLSPTSINKIHIVCRQVFSILYREASLTDNPFANIPLLQKKYEEREPFTTEEIKKILTAHDDFCVPLFKIGLYTGLREGDVCCLKWKYVDFQSGFINLKMQKTEINVAIPLLDTNIFLELKEAAGDSEYVLPKHHEMYVHNRDGISYRIKKFLKKLDISSTQSIGGRKRLHSYKDFHSCRHTFAMICCERGIPLVDIQLALGHTDIKTTNIYTSHLNLQRLKKSFSNFNSILDNVSQHNSINVLVLLERLKRFYLNADSRVPFFILEHLSVDAAKELFALLGARYYAKK